MKPEGETTRAIDWAAMRAEFPVCKEWAFLDHAAVAPLSRRARDAMLEWAAEQTERGGVGEARWMARIEEVRGLAARLIGADPDEIAFVPNTSAGLGLVAEGFPWRPGDRVVSAAEEYPSNVYPWLNLAGRGVTLHCVPLRAGRIWTEDIEAALDERTRLVSISFVEYASGFRNDLEQLAQLCRARGIYLVVDAIQGLGVVPLDVRRIPLDFLAADGHKWLLGPEGAGIFYVRRELLELLHPLGVGWHSVVRDTDFSTIDFRLKPSAARWEGGSFNVAGIAGLGGSLGLLLDLGIEAIFRRVLSLTDHLIRRADETGARVASSLRPEDRSGIVSLEWRGRDHHALAAQARRAGIAVSCRGGRLRVSPHCYNTEAEIDRLIDAVR